MNIKKCSASVNGSHSTVEVGEGWRKCLNCGNVYALSFTGLADSRVDLSKLGFHPVK